MFCSVALKSNLKLLVVVLGKNKASSLENAYIEQNFQHSSKGGAGWDKVCGRRGGDTSSPLMLAPIDRSALQPEGMWSSEHHQISLNREEHPHSYRYKYCCFSLHLHMLTAKHSEETFSPFKKMLWISCIVTIEVSKSNRAKVCAVKKKEKIERHTVARKSLGTLHADELAGKSPLKRQNQSYSWWPVWPSLAED